MKIFDICYESQTGDHTEAIDYLRGMVWCEVETTEQNMPAYSDYIDSFEGVDLYYCFGADHYFFVDATED